VSVGSQWAKTGPPAVVKLPEEIDITNADHVRGELQAALDQGAATVIADLSGTMFCDSSGLRALVGAHKRAAADGVRVLLVIGDSQVRRLFALTGMDSVIEVYPSVERALAGGSARS
jgi:anti-sigma B factor antagonist